MIISPQSWPWGTWLAHFPPHAVPQLHISRFGAIPKGQTDKWRFIVDLSHPKGHSVNNGKSKPLCSLKYITIDEAIKGIIHYGWEALLTKIDIKSAFHFLCTQLTGTCKA